MTTLVCDPPVTEATLPGEVASAGHSSWPQSDSICGPLPQLGFSGYLVPGKGEYVLSVDCGTAAARIGLQPGDVILAVNGHRVARHGAWSEAMVQAGPHGGSLTLRIRSGQTGRITDRTCHVFSPA
jgi:S1-C subfamily serine protease